MNNIPLIPVIISAYNTMDIIEEMLKLIEA